MIPEYLSPLANHLWQSSLVAAAAAMLAVALRKNSARIRYWLWLTAAMKFLIPFSVLVSIGQQFEWRTAPSIAQWPVSTVTEIGMPFTVAPAVSVPPGTAPRVNMVPAMLFSLWLFGFLVSLWFWFRSWRRARKAVKAASLVGPDLQVNGISVRVLYSKTRLEPAVIGIVRPALLLPDGIADRMTADQLKAIVIHELCHVRHRDNLGTAVYMAAETLFWFYPLVRWIGKRLFDERERACDEEVLRHVKEPHIYAEGILRVCRLYLESPAAIAAGVTSSDLRKRIREIISHRKVRALNIQKKLLLAAAGASAIALPLIVGVFNPSATTAQTQNAAPTFEVATIKPGDPNARGFGGSCHGTDSGYSGLIPITPPPLGRCRFSQVTLKMLIQQAYDFRGPNADDMVLGAPGWITSERFTIETKAEKPTSVANMRVMLRALLQDRFKLKAHKETRELPGFLLVTGRNGSKLSPAKGDEDKPGISGKGRGHFTAANASMMQLVTVLAMHLTKPVLDQTGLTGTYNFSLTWTPDENAGGFEGMISRLPLEVQARIPRADPNGPSIFTAVQEQLGLRLESRRVPTEVLIIDGAERPIPD